MPVSGISFLGVAVTFTVMMRRRPRQLALLRTRSVDNHKCEICDRIIEKFEFHSYRVARCIVGGELLLYFIFVCFQAVLAGCCLALAIWLVILYASDRTAFKLGL